MILMLLDFLICFSLLKNLEGKIQNYLEMMVGDNRLGKFLSVISKCTLFIYLSIFLLLVNNFREPTNHPMRRD